MSDLSSIVALWSDLSDEEQRTGIVRDPRHFQKVRSAIEFFDAYKLPDFRYQTQLLRVKAVVATADKDFVNRSPIVWRALVDRWEPYGGKVISDGGQLAIEIDWYIQVMKEIEDAASSGDDGNKKRRKSDNAPASNTTG